MHSRPINQAAGLMDLAIPESPKLMAVVSHGDEQAELPLLWRMCSALVGFGYSVAVLDGSMEESPDNPGLEQMLDYSFWRGKDTETPSWRIVPSRNGLQTLCVQAQSNPKELFNLTDLGRFFTHENVLLVYSDARTLTLMLKELGVKPLLATSNSKASLFTSYLALKRLLLNGKIEPTIANVKNSETSASGLRDSSPGKGLAECAEQFLGYQVNAINIDLPNTDDSPCLAVERLALAMLERAVPLQVHWSDMGSRSLVRNPDSTVRSH